MKIITFEACDADVPAAWRFVSRIVTPMQGAKSKVSDAFLPTAFHGATRDEAEARAQAFWDAEIERFRKSSDIKEAAGARMAGARAARTAKGVASAGAPFKPEYDPEEEEAV